MKRKILIILGSGGHTAQMLKLLNLLGEDYDYEYVINREDQITRKKKECANYFNLKFTPPEHYILLIRK